MRVLDILNCVLLLLLFAGTSVAATYEDVSDIPTISSGYGYIMSQSVSGVGFTSTHFCIKDQAEVLQTHSSGSGHYSYDSTLQFQNFSYSDPDNSYVTAGQKIELQENTSFAYSPVMLNNIGGFRAGPIKSLYNDLVTTGNSGGTIMSVGFDNTRTLSKDLHTKTSGVTNLENILQSGGYFETSMKYDVAFTGTEKQGVSFKESDKKTPTRMVDESYSGTFKIAKNLDIKASLTNWDYGETSEDPNAINWLPCACFQGYDSMDLTDQRYHSAKDFFDCTSCWPAKPCTK
jgi:hypothetical protein